MNFSIISELRKVCHSVEQSLSIERQPANQWQIQDKKRGGGAPDGESQVALGSKSGVLMLWRKGEKVTKSATAYNVMLCSYGR